MKSAVIIVAVLTIVSALFVAEPAMAVGPCDPNIQVCL
jgi:hypothetical protein